MRAWLLGKIEDLSANGIHLHLNHRSNPFDRHHRADQTQSVAHMPGPRDLQSPDNTTQSRCEFLEPVSPEDIE